MICTQVSLTETNYSKILLNWYYSLWSAIRIIANGGAIILIALQMRRGAIILIALASSPTCLVAKASSPGFFSKAVVLF
jgi:hypothetical protein